MNSKHFIYSYNISIIRILNIGRIIRRKHGDFCQGIAREIVIFTILQIEFRKMAAQKLSNVDCKTPMSILKVLSSTESECAARAY